MGIELKDPTTQDLLKSAFRGEPSYVWRAGQERRLHMIIKYGGEQLKGKVLENGCGVGMYIERLSPLADMVVGLEYDFERSSIAHKNSPHLICSMGENLPFSADHFDLILSHEVLEHVMDDEHTVKEMTRVLKPGGKIIVFVPNRGYPFETHGMFIKGKYRFGNIPLLNYLPGSIREKLAPHVRVYTTKGLVGLFAGLPIRIVHHEIIFGAYDNIIARSPKIGRVLREILQWFEKTPLRIFGLSHFMVVEKIEI